MAGPLQTLARSRFAGVALVLLCLAVFLPGLFTIPPIDRDESRFAQASRQMFESVALPLEKQEPKLHSGGIAIPYVMETPRLNKPPLIYWLQSLSAAAFTGGDPLRDSIWMYRIPGVLCAIGAVLATWRLGRSMTSRLAAFVAAAALALCPVVVFDAHQARADQLLLLTVVLAQGTLWKIFRGDARLRTAVLFWLLIGMGVLAKGPITPMIAVLTALSVSFARGEWRWLLRLRLALGVAIVAAVVAPWVYAVASRVGWNSYLETVWGETIGRSVEGKEGHWGPPGYHTLLAFFLLWPIALGLPGVIAIWWARLRRGGGSVLSRVRAQTLQRPAEAFLLAWIIPSWIVFECVGTKLPHYTLPLYPALCILGARVLVSMCRVRAKDGKPRGAFLHLTRIWFGTGIVVLIGIGVLAMSLSWWQTLGWWGWSGGNQLESAPRTNWMLIPVVVGMLVAMLLAGRSLAQVKIMRSLIFSWGALAIGYMLLLGAVAPDAMSLSTRIAARLPDAKSSKVALSGYQEDSLVFLLRGNAIRIQESELSTVIGDHAATIVAAAPLRAGAETERPKVELRGFNIAKGRCQSVFILRPEPSK